MSLSRTWNNNYPDGTTNPQMRGFQKDLREYLHSPDRLCNAGKLMLCEDSEMYQWYSIISACMADYFPNDHMNSIKQHQCYVWSTNIISPRREFIVIAIGRPLATLPNDSTCDSAKSDWNPESKIIFGRSSSWNLWRRPGEYELVLPNNYFFTWYHLYGLCLYT